MDYTLVHYRVERWENEAFEHGRELLAGRGWPVADLVFDPREVILGLAFDLDLGNLVKATRFGYVIRAQHGTKLLEYDELRETYSGDFVELGEPRWEFMNTLFSLSEASLFNQLVDLLDAGKLPGVMGYHELHRSVRNALDTAHAQGALKAKIVATPDQFVELDEELALTLLDQHHAGRTLLLITNSDWAYTRSMMAYAVDPFLPAPMTWRDLFDVVIVDARKPRFFNGSQPAYRVEDEERGLLAPYRGLLERGRVYAGGDARLVETSLGLAGADLLYVGDHLFGDVHASKAMLRWRTGLVVRELEYEIDALVEFRPTEEKLVELMAAKTELDHTLAQLRLSRLRQRHDYGPAEDVSQLDRRINSTIRSIADLDARVAPLAQAAGEIGNVNWGPLLRAGNDKSLFARQIERHADLYMSRVSNLLAETPYGYLRADRGRLPHDPT
jgi:5'-nucleotidase